MKSLSHSLFIFTLLLSQIALSQVFSGYKRTPNAQLIELTEPVDRFVETPDAFKILLKRHPGFYHFPKAQNDVSIIKKLLNVSLAENKQIKITVDANSGEIMILDFIEGSK